MRHVRRIRGSGGGCFPAGVMISTPDGLRAIETLRPGDAVLCFDDAGELHIGQVTQTFEHAAQDVWRFDFWGGIMLPATPNHFILNQMNAFATVGSLEIGDDAAINGDGHVIPLKSKTPLVNAPVFNISVSPHHTFIANNVRVHNAGLGLGRHAMALRGEGGGGGKGGGGASRPAVEAPNTLRSKATARVLDLIGEGEIVGLVDPETGQPLPEEDYDKAVFLQGTRVKNADGSTNFSGVVIDQRVGTPDQTYMEGFPEVESEVTVGVRVRKNQPVVRTISDPTVNAARVTIRIPRLYQQNTTTGDVNPTSVQLKIEVQPNGGDYSAHYFDLAWLSFSSATPSDAQGIQVTVQTTTPGNAAAESYSLGVEYRLVGSGTWLPLGSVSGTVNNTVEYTYGSGEDTSIYISYKKTTVSRTFSKTGLEAGSYEFRVTAGSLVQAQYFGNAPVTISGKTTSPYDRAYRIPLPAGGAPWNIRVSRITDDATSESVQNETYFSSYTEIIDQKVAYRDSAIIGVAVDSQLFGGDVPSRAYHVKGLKIRIPSNYDPNTREYDGIWDGTFQIAWSNNPAWVLYDLLINDRYGLGEFIDSNQIDKWALYEIGRYCDEIVPAMNGGGGEPRFTFNGVINTQEDAYNVLQAVISAARGMIFWASGAVTATQDAPADPVKIVTPANVIGGMFNYQGTPLKSRHTVAMVSWNDPADNFRAAVEVVQDHDAIRRFGWRPTEVVAFGCTSRGQAYRYGKWILDTNQNETDILTYKAGLDHADVRPGHIIAVYDPDYSGVRMGGRIKSATSTSIEIDDGVDLYSGETYTVTIVLEDGTLHERELTNAPGSGVTVFTWTDPLPDLPIVNAMWGLTSTSLTPRQFRVLSVVETQAHEFEITAVFNDPTKYDRVEQNVNVDPPPYSSIPTGPLQKPQNITLLEYLYEVGPQVKSAITVSWQASPDPRVQSYEIEAKSPTDQTFVLRGVSTTLSFDILDTNDGIWQFRVRAVAPLIQPSPYAESGEVLVEALGGAPSNITNFRGQVIGAQMNLSWDRNIDLDHKFYRLKFSPLLTGATWGSGVILADNIDTTSITVPAMVGTYMLKAVDRSNVESEEPALVVSSIGGVEGLNAVATLQQHTAFSGYKDGVEKIGNELWLASVDSMAEWTTLEDVLTLAYGVNGLELEGYYYFHSALDLTDIYTSRITALMDIYGDNLANVMSTWATLSSVATLAGSDPSQWSASLQMATSYEAATEVDVRADLWPADGTVPMGTFSRGSEATYVSRLGVIAQRSADQIRLDYDPVSHELRGWLIEEARTNLATYSAAPSNAVWTKVNASASGAEDAPDGTAVAEAVTEDSATGAHGLERDFTISAGAAVAWSGFFKADGRDFIALRVGAVNGFQATFDLSTGEIATAVNAIGTGEAIDAGIEAFADGWYRCWITGKADPADTSVTAYAHLGEAAGDQPSYAGDGASGALYWGLQFEEGRYPTSYIPTEAAAVLREADDWEIPVSEFDFLASEGTIIAHFCQDIVDPDADSPVLQLDDGSQDECLRLGRDSAGIYGRISDGGVDDSMQWGGGITEAGADYFAALAFKAADFGFAAGGEAAQSITSGAVPTVDTLRIGSDTDGNYLNGHIVGFAYAPGRYTGETLALCAEDGADGPWNEWTDLIVGDYTARSYRFRLKLQTQDAAITPRVRELSVGVDMPDRVAGEHDVLCPADGITVEFDPPFKDVPAFTPVGQEMETGDYWVYSVTADGFTLQFRNSAGVGVERTFDWIARGYGYRG